MGDEDEDEVEVEVAVDGRFCGGFVPPVLFVSFMFPSSPHQPWNQLLNHSELRLMDQEIAK